MTIRPVEIELFHADRWTDKIKLTDFFAILRSQLKWIKPTEEPGAKENREIGIV